MNSLRNQINTINGSLPAEHKELKYSAGRLYGTNLGDIESTSPQHTSINAEMPQIVGRTR